ncbi:hypothetical protein GCM10025867_24280 [Frondihabitans sucicola]|uniref:Uncharacterized protein n=1 Tax=Frondihabitans sucicola TaxID=1268041 RepID=A0ABM8GP21_9MICO|nr:hypothetical protein GCM10025867_24280 [Frondihabitans sucicola]
MAGESDTRTKPTESRRPLLPRPSAVAHDIVRPRAPFGPETGQAVEERLLRAPEIVTGDPDHSPLVVLEPLAAPDVLPEDRRVDAMVVARVL